MEKKGNDYRKMIQGSQWIRLRKWKLSRNPLCEDCKERGRIVLATEVHHIMPVEDGLSVIDRERLMYAIGNLRSLCHDCHIRAHKELGRSGKEQARRRNESRLVGFKKRFMGGNDTGG